MDPKKQIETWDKQVTEAKMDKAKDLIKKWTRKSIRLKEDFYRSGWMQGQIFYVAEAIADAFKNGNKVMFCGSGGSASDSAHAAAEFLNRLSLGRDNSLPAIDLSAMNSTITAIANDYGYDYIFSKQVEGLGKAGDVLIGISTSGNSKNVLRAIHQAQSMGITGVLLTGKLKPDYYFEVLPYRQGKIGTIPNYIISLDSEKTSIIQETHIMILHVLVYLVDYFMFGVDYLEE